MSVDDGPDFCDFFTFPGDLPGGEENCDPNILEVASEDQDLSLVVAMIKAAELEEVFDCAGT